MSNALEVKFEKELGRIELPRNEALVFRAVEYAKGGLRFDARRYYTSESGESRPTSKGVSLKPDMIKPLIEAIKAFEETGR